MFYKRFLTPLSQSFPYYAKKVYDYDKNDKNALSKTSSDVFKKYNIDKNVFHEKNNDFNEKESTQTKNDLVLINGMIIFFSLAFIYFYKR
jgi:hypothetical protein